MSTLGPNRVEIISDAETKTFKMLVNGAEIKRVKAFSLKGDASDFGTDVIINFDADTLSVR